jgi:uncharacterized SAM-binding protein YcdF (DUF218 family)
MRRALIRFLAAVGAATILLSLLAGLVLVNAPRLLVTGDQPAPADGIVILGGGLGRAVHAAWLYHQGLAPRVFVSRPQVGQNREMFADYGVALPREEDINLVMLRHDGVPEAAIVVYGQYVLSTVEEAEALRAALHTTPAKPPARLLLVTSPFHTRRARLVFERVFPETEILAVATGNPVPADWWNDRGSALMVVTELAKLAYWYAGGAFRSHGVPGSRGI